MPPKKPSPVTLVHPDDLSWIERLGFQKTTWGNTIGLEQDNAWTTLGVVFSGTLAHQGYSVNAKFNRQYLRVHVPETVKKCVDAVDAHMLSLAKEDARFQVMDGLLMTSKTWDTLFRPSIGAFNQLTLSVAPNNMAVFDADGILLTQPDLSVLLQDDMVLRMVVVPTCLWCLNEQAGIAWSVRQLRLEKVAPTVPFSLPSSTDEDS